MVKENRYLVLKWDDIYKYLEEPRARELRYISQEVLQGRIDDGRGNPSYVVVKEGWPMYESTWSELEKWVDKKEGPEEKADKLLSALCTVLDVHTQQDAENLLVGFRMQFPDENVEGEPRAIIDAITTLKEYLNK